MRLAFVDLEFAWPPPGGAQIHLVQDLAGLARLGHEVHLFAPLADNVWRFGHVDAQALRVPVTPLPFDRKPFPPEATARRVREAVDAFRPDVVVLGFGFYLKRQLAEALAHYPLLSRYYAYEMLCPRDFWLYRDETTCPNDYLATPRRCALCFLERFSPHLGSGDLSSYAEEFLRAGGLSPRFHRAWVDHFRRYDAVIVTNALMRDRVAPYCRRVHVVSGGVDASAFTPAPPPVRAPGERQVILLAGRVDDPMKGAALLRRACADLAGTRGDFDLWVTGPAPPDARPHERFVGWHAGAALADLYRAADICVVPSLWDEPFGLVAVEAMACGRPVCVSRAGGLQHIVEDGVSGLVFERGDAADLARCLARLLDDPALQHALGAAGRRRVETTYDWPVVIETHWPGILREATA